MSEIEELYEALEEARDADQVASACVLYEEILTIEEEENIASTLLYATDLIDLGNFAQAEATLQRLGELCEEGDSRELLLFNLATLHEKRGGLADAEKHYRLAHEANSARGDYLLLAANMAFHRGESGKAEYLAREALKFQCDPVDAHSALGAYLASQRRFAEARLSFEEVLKGEPENEHAREWIDDLEQVE